MTYIECSFVAIPKLLLRKVELSMFPHFIDSLGGNNIFIYIYIYTLFISQ